MDNKDFSNIGEQIRESVEKAMDSMDFKQLNSVISDTVSGAIDEVRRQIVKGAGEFSSGRGGSGQNGKTIYRECTVKDVPPERKKPVIRANFSGRTAGILYTVFGGVGLGFTGLALLIVLLIAVFGKPLWGGLAVAGGILALIALGFGAMLGKGSALRGRVRRLKLYLSAAGDKAYCSIEDLARRLGRTRKFVVKDVKKMIRAGMLPEAYMDEQQTCLMLNGEVYEEYRKMREAERQREAEKRTAGNRPEPTPLDEAVNRGKAYLKTLREANEAIPGEVISLKLSRLEMIISRIFETVEAHPEQLGEIEKFMEYYLPTTVKLVEAYRDFDGVPVQGENVSSAKKEIEQTLDTINQAFERLLDGLYQDAAFDASTDASVLQAMLKKDGWAESDFDRRTGA